MAVFSSTHIVKVDAKGRVCVPASFRAVLSAEAFQGIVAVPSHRLPAIEGVPSSRMEKISASLDSFSLFSEDQDDLATAIFGGAMQLPMDETGRIVLSRELMAHANISNSAAFMGLGAKFQIWNPDALRDRIRRARERVHEEKLSLPGVYVR